MDVIVRVRACHTIMACRAIRWLIRFESDDFYDCADELGLLIQQDAIFSNAVCVRARARARRC